MSRRHRVGDTLELIAQDTRCQRYEDRAKGALPSLSAYLGSFILNTLLRTGQTRLYYLYLNRPSADRRPDLLKVAPRAFAIAGGRAHCLREMPHYWAETLVASLCLHRQVVLVNICLVDYDPSSRLWVPLLFEQELLQGSVVSSSLQRGLNSPMPACALGAATHSALLNHRPGFGTEQVRHYHSVCLDDRHGYRILSAEKPCVLRLRT
jgi:hypothetical protein